MSVFGTMIKDNLDKISSKAEDCSISFAAGFDSIGNRSFRNAVSRSSVAGLGRGEIGKFKYFLSGLVDSTMDPFIEGTSKYFENNSEMLEILKGILDGAESEKFCQKFFDRMEKNLAVSSARDHSADRRKNYENGGSIMQELVWALALHLKLEDPDYRWWTDFESRSTLPTWSETVKTRKKWNEFVEALPFDDYIKDAIRVDEYGFCQWNMTGHIRKPYEVKKGYLDNYKTFEETHNVFKDDNELQKYYNDLIENAGKVGEEKEEETKAVEPEVNEEGLKKDVIAAIKNNVKGVPDEMINEFIKEFSKAMNNPVEVVQKGSDPIIKDNVIVVENPKVIKDDLKDAKLSEEAAAKNPKTSEDLIIKNNKEFEEKIPQLKKLGDMVRKEGFVIKYADEVPQYPGLIPVSFTKDGYTKNLFVDPGKIYGDTFRLITQDRKDGNLLKETFISFSDKNKELIISAIKKDGLTVEQRRAHYAPLARGTEAVIERTDMRELNGDCNFGTWRSIVTKLANLYNQIPGVRFRLTNVKDKDNFELVCDDKVSSCVNLPIYETLTHAWAFNHGLKITFNPTLPNGYTAEYMDGTPIDFKMYPDPVKTNASPIEVAQQQPAPQIVTESK